MPYTIQTPTSGRYTISPDSITKRTIQDVTTSPGLLIKRHYKEAVAVMQIIVFMCSDKIYESAASYWHEEKDLENAPHLDRVLRILEEQLNILTDGEYQAEDSGFKYAAEIDAIRWQIHSLKAGRYYEANNLRYGHQRGIPRISTVGNKLCDQTMDLIWKMDSDAPNKLEEMHEALEKVQHTADISPENQL